MALGDRNQEQQPSFWIAVDKLPRSEGHAFYCKLNQLLREAGFDEFVERLCEPYCLKSPRTDFFNGLLERFKTLKVFEFFMRTQKMPLQVRLVKV